MKNKGFTLIELLSVIVVIAIVTLIAFPVISGVVEKTKLKALEDSAYGLVEASNLYYAQYQNNETKRFDKNDEENTLKNLSYKGSIEKGTVIINSKGQVTVCISDGKNSAYKNYNENKVTAVAKKTCTIPSNTYIVYLDDERTIKELSNEELTDKITELEKDLASLKELASNKVVTTDENGELKSSEVTDTELSYLSGTTGNIQTQLGSITDSIGTLNNKYTTLSSSVGTSINSINSSLNNKIQYYLIKTISPNSTTVELNYSDLSQYKMLYVGTYPSGNKFNINYVLSDYAATSSYASLRFTRTSVISSRLLVETIQLTWEPTSSSSPTITIYVYNNGAISTTNNSGSVTLYLYGYK